MIDSVRCEINSVYFVVSQQSHYFNLTRSLSYLTFKISFLFLGKIRTTDSSYSWEYPGYIVDDLIVAG